MQVIFAWAAVLLVMVAPYPTTRWLLRHSPLPSSRWLALIMTVGLGIGTLTWIMMVEGMLGIPFQLWSILLPYVIVCVPGTFLWLRGRKPESRPAETEIKPQSKGIKLIGRLVVIVVSAAVLLNAIYWPF